MIKPEAAGPLVIYQACKGHSDLRWNHIPKRPDEKGNTMRRPDPRAWMLTEAIEQIQTADRLQRLFFQLSQPGESPCWEPPVDMYVNDLELGLLIALPGVAAGRFEVELEQQAIVVRGERSFGASVGPGAILRLEIPYGRFERRILLPFGSFQLTEMLLENGCLKLTLERLK